MINTPGNFS